MVTLYRLSIRRGFRGIRQLEVVPRGRSMGILGPNGSGKSSVVDALDFLLTGSVRRLKGEGAGDLSLPKHGKHIDAPEAEAWVEAEFTVDGGKTAVLRRTIVHPAVLTSTQPTPPDLGRLLQLAERGHHLLTRREILRYVFAEPGRRGEQVGALLQLDRVDDIRKETQGAARDAADALATEHARVKTLARLSLGAVKPSASDFTDLLSRTNAHRAALGAEPVAALDPPDVRRAVRLPAEAAAPSPLHSPRTTALLDSGVRWFQDGAEQFRQRYREYASDRDTLLKAEEAVLSLRAAELLRLGLDLLGTGDCCPLCLTPWEQPELRALLERRWAEAGEAAATLSRLRDGRSALRRALDAVGANFRALAVALGPDLESGSESLDAFASDLEGIRELLLPDPLDRTGPGRVEVERSLGEAAPQSVRQILDGLISKCGSLPDLAGAQKAWDELGAVEETLHQLKEARASEKRHQQLAEELELASTLFVQARDSVLQDTYDSISERFAELYRGIHGVEAKGFSAKMNPTKAGLKMEVDYHGRGSYPPNALHSEGHQDSMGVCLFLALTEYLSKGSVPLLILDDVLMSVDRRHRRAVASTLKANLDHTQLIITTHDLVWWKQLRLLGVVDPRVSLEFLDWSLDLGPLCEEHSGDLLGQARKALEAGNTPQAAHALRYAVESFFPDICDALGAEVRFRAAADWEAGQFLRAALVRYKELLKKARETAASWSDSGPLWDSLEDNRKAAFQAFQAENWAVNKVLHFNDWADLTPEDFAPVLAAYEGLFALYVCAECGTGIRLVEDGPDPVNVRCDCNKTNWNLTRKK